MTAQDLEALFGALGTPTAQTLSARPVAEGSRYRVAKRADGSPGFLISMPEDAPPAFGSHLANLLYAPRERIRVEAPDGAMMEGLFTVLACRSADPELEHYFFRVAATLVDELGAAPHPLVVDRAVESVLELFRALERPGRRSIQGVWAELFLIVHARDPVRALAAWHSDPSNLHDFAAGVDRLEVKSTTAAIREHEFRLEQLSTLTTGTVLVASLMLLTSPDGLTIQDLVERLDRRLPHGGEHRSRVEAIVALGLGSEWRASATARFDAVSALTALRVFEAAHVPSVDPRTPPTVRGVHFTADLSSATPINLEDVGVRFPALRDLLPSGGRGA
jgi:hypothetical protein